ncbi:hypothetical protein AB6A40_010564 [Gnathostoma spinigerum]|uniref:Uncharacterized protein n=1 Tax=Gnathostoma spinigerum TaxID=75299 RepID=A0ABD6EV64_9BILA
MLVEGDDKQIRSLLSVEKDSFDLALVVLLLVYRKVKLKRDVLDVLDDIRPHPRIVELYLDIEFKDVRDSTGFDILSQEEPVKIRYDKTTEHICELLEAHRALDQLTHSCCGR